MQYDAYAMRCMMLRRDTEKQTSKSKWGKTPVVTDDTTNKGPRPRGPAEARREGNSHCESSHSMLIFSTPLTRGDYSGETKLEGVRLTH